jgi:hypothetical protein
MNIPLLMEVVVEVVVLEVVTDSPPWVILPLPLATKVGSLALHHPPAKSPRNQNCIAPLLTPGYLRNFPYT